MNVVVYERMTIGSLKNINAKTKRRKKSDYRFGRASGNRKMESALSELAHAFTDRPG